MIAFGTKFSPYISNIITANQFVLQITKNLHNHMLYGDAGFYLSESFLVFHNKLLKFSDDFV